MRDMARLWFFFQAEDGIRVGHVTGVQTCALPISLVVGMAAYNGRIFVSNRDSQKSATGHGSPMPTTVHGGPGRAGGGEELGGIRSILHYKIGRASCRERVERQ